VLTEIAGRPAHVVTAHGTRIAFGPFELEQLGCAAIHCFFASFRHFDHTVHAPPGLPISGVICDL
jgi:hypothetical protein